MIDTIAMIGSPAVRGAVASTAAEGRCSFAATPPVSDATVTIAAKVTKAGRPQRRIAPVICAVVVRFTMPFLGRNACPRCVDPYQTAILD
ncbi:hypothetical protein M2192_003642 [Bradyrhizobium elkanii USDA 61]|uniref:Uncharacterized protein n=1 Tax=Bradyrhizobium elkanii TaxID=29448 RepID=A0A8I2CA09_BRAEL|nr:hypothetical protein [Bradyrhizobium elkanii]MCS4006682.1 hypothetical protein [Bradyrhizobium elkanii USDA 61]MCP1729535.1 hypothetical protein [Bradyrhizobium elkanii]MCP1756273.1 hypothetical protein [Bradyrhizobium elkanii]MCP1929989.1 hypothetical protein [Bradyrhizobium elkanii]